MKLFDSQTQTGCTWRHGDHVDGKNNSKKSHGTVWLGFYPKLELHYPLFWHQNGRLITWVISKNFLPELGVIIEKRSLPLAAYLNVNICQLQRCLFFRKLSYIHIGVNIDRRNFKCPKIYNSRLIFFHVLSCSLLLYRWVKRLERVFLVAIVFVKRWKISKKDIS